MIEEFVSVTLQCPTCKSQHLIACMDGQDFNPLNYGIVGYSYEKQAIVAAGGQCPCGTLLSIKHKIAEQT